ncbi:MAG: hypothetical protein CL470_07270 [Acidimicrobiaceae bacterium]|nr:hypothetical protein [Acidimicrobiaceae bacterium]|tara:strand:+ start:66 stop:575 length:510 start_codon:yes stop_codon:yes gene_type:complete
MDLKNVLNESEQEESKSIRKHKKPVQLRDIENRSASNRKGGLIECETDEQIKDLLEKEKEDIYKQSWNKLDNGMKINRLKLYIDRETIENELSDEEVIQLKRLLMNACQSNKLNKNTDIIYDKEQCTIKTIKILKRKESRYILEINDVKKQKPTGKSKSNIERLIKSRN